MKFTVDARTLRDALKGCDKAVSKDAFRPGLQRVQIIVKDNQVQLTALDGIRMIQYTLTGRAMEPGVALVPPKLMLSALHSTNDSAVVEINGDQVTVQTDVIIQLTVPVLTDAYPDTDRIWTSPSRDQITIHVNSGILSDITTACGVVSVKHAISLDIPHNPLYPIVAHGGDNDCRVRGLILPIRPKEGS